MFFTYLRRELRRRMRQAIFIALGLALGVGLVITVTAASAGVKNAQGTVLHALYGVGTDVTVTKTPKAGSFTPGSFGFGFRAGTRSRPAARTKINDSTLAASPTLAAISSASGATGGRPARRGGGSRRADPGQPHDQRHRAGRQRQRRPELPRELHHQQLQRRRG